MNPPPHRDTVLAWQTSWYAMVLWDEEGTDNEGSL